MILHLCLSIPREKARSRSARCPIRYQKRKRDKGSQPLLHNKIAFLKKINATYIGRTLEVLVQGDARKGEGLAVGKSDGFKTVVFPREGVADNALTNVEITQTTLRTLTGRRVP